MPCSFVTLSSSVMNCFPLNAVWCMDLCLHAKEKRKDHLQGFRSWSHECPVVKPGFAIPNIQVICDFTGILWLVFRLWSLVYKGKVNTNYDVNVWFSRELIDQGNVEKADDDEEEMIEKHQRNVAYSNAMHFRNIMLMKHELRTTHSVRSPTYTKSRWLGR